MTDARLAASFLEVAYTGTAVDRRLAGAMLEVATGAVPTGASVAPVATVTATTAVTRAVGASVPITGAASAGTSAAFAVGASVTSTASVTAAGGRLMQIAASIPLAAAATSGALSGKLISASVVVTSNVTGAVAKTQPADTPVATTFATSPSAAAHLTAGASRPSTFAVSSTASTGFATSTIALAAAVTAAAASSGPVATISAVELDGDIAAITVTGLVAPQPPTPEGTAGLQATIANPTLAISPGSLVVKVANGVPGHTVTLSVAGNSLPDTTAVLDESGAAPGVNVRVAVASSGSHTLIVSDNTLSPSLAGPLKAPLTAGPLGLDPGVSLPFAVTSVATPGSFVVPTYPPPAAVQNTTGVRKWVFQDPSSSDVYHFTFNPNQMTSPFGSKNIQWTATTAIDGQKLAFEGQQAPVQWQFQGFIRSPAEYDAFVHWQSKRNRIWITDHFGRAWLGYITQFDVVPHRSYGVAWSHDYTMHVLLFDGPVTPQ